MFRMLVLVFLCWLGSSVKWPFTCFLWWEGVQGDPELRVWTWPEVTASSRRPKPSGLQDSEGPLLMAHCYLRRFSRRCPPSRWASSRGLAARRACWGSHSSTRSPRMPRASTPRWATCAHGTPRKGWWPRRCSEGALEGRQSPRPPPGWHTRGIWADWPGRKHPVFLFNKAFFPTCAPDGHVSSGPHTPRPVGSNPPPSHQAPSPGTVLAPSLPGSQWQRNIPSGELARGECRNQVRHGSCFSVWRISKETHLDRQGIGIQDWAEQKQA